MPRSSIPRSCSSRPPTAWRGCAQSDASAQGAPLFDQMLAAYAAFADQTLAPMQKAIQGWNGIEVNRLVDKVLPGSAAPM